MADEVKDKVSEEPKLDNGLPQPKFSEQEPVSPTSSLSPEVISAISAALIPSIEETIDRKFKSTTDKRFSKLGKTEDTLKETLAFLKSQNVAIPKELEAQMELRDYVDQRIKDVASNPDKSMLAKGADTKSEFNVIEELKQFGLDINDQDVVKLATGNYRNHDHFRAEAAGLALRKVKSPPPSETTGSPLQGVPSGAMTEEKREELSGTLIELLKSPEINFAKIEAIRKQLKGE